MNDSFLGWRLTGKLHVFEIRNDNQQRIVLANLKIVGVLRKVLGCSFPQGGECLF
jgi:hypothetical protein